MSQADPNQLAGVLRAPMEPGMPVDVRSRYDGTWCGGFDVVEVVTVPAGSMDRRYRLRRHSDGHVLPGLFSNLDVTPTRTRRF